MKQGPSCILRVESEYRFNWESFCLLRQRSSLSLPYLFQISLATSTQNTSRLFPSSLICIRPALLTVRCAPCLLSGFTILTETRVRNHKELLIVLSHLTIYSKVMSKTHQQAQQIKAFSDVEDLLQTNQLTWALLLRLGMLQWSRGTSSSIIAWFANLVDKREKRFSGAPQWWQCSKRDFPNFTARLPEYTSTGVWT